MMISCATYGIEFICLGQIWN